MTLRGQSAAVLAGPPVWPSTREKTQFQARSRLFVLDVWRTTSPAPPQPQNFFPTPTPAHPESTTTLDAHPRPHPLLSPPLQLPHSSTNSNLSIMIPNASKFAYVEKHASKLPTLHTGELTPLVIDDMILTCTNYFNAKDVAADKQVATILGCFMDPHFTNWVHPETTRTRLIALPFSQFIKEFKEKFLDDDWETLVRSDIMSMHQVDDQTFDHNLQTRHQLEAGMADDLRFICMRSDKLKELIAKPASTLDQYIHAVNRLDKERRRNLNIQCRLIAEANKENKCKTHESDNDERAAKRREPKSGESASTASSSANPYPPNSPTPNASC
ncbi:hypothetical protein B0H10DRAFT_2220964 [Mycena sp. CBHHK59/15]|nr:hypothetical protein B0H10DRAFT_2220964 [Mycena sp. CBHHK59/15]